MTNRSWNWNPDLRVELVREYVRKHFPSHSLLDYALAVEKVTTEKKDTLTLNVDGCIAVSFVDMLRDSGAFAREEVDEYIKIGTLNGLFVLSHSIGFIDHHFGQKRHRAPLYRHPADDIFSLTRLAYRGSGVALGIRKYWEANRKRTYQQKNRCLMLLCYS